MELNKLLTAFRSKAGFECTEHEIKPSQIRLIGRVPNAALRTWHQVVPRILKAHKPDWSVDISKAYFLKPDYRYAWRVLIGGRDLPGAVNALMNIIEGLDGQRTVTELTEFPLVGYDPKTRNAKPGERGGFGIDTPFLGPRGGR